MKKVMVFGVFDGLHAGHVHFLREARSRGDFLVAVIASDAAVLTLKNRAPCFPFRHRAAAVRRSGLADRVRRSDTELGSWRVIEKEKPDIVAVGYDQKAMLKNLRAARRRIRHSFRIRIMCAHRPRAFHSRLAAKGY